ncbi:MAG: carbon-nitrogen hydrolase family protein [Actinomycetota bacterium]
MRRFRIALLQLSAREDDVEANLARADTWCRRAAEADADLAVLPEMWSTGYTPVPQSASERKAWFGRAEPLDGPYISHFANLADELDMAIGATLLERVDGGVRNTVVVLDRTGERVLVYAKSHTCDFDWERTLTRGESFPVATLRTATDEVRVGAMICYDREFPEPARLLMLAGAEVIVVPNCCDLDEVRVAQTLTRATKNMVVVAVANHAPPGADGGSIAVSPIAYEGQGGPPVDTTVARGGPGEELVLCDVDLDTLRAWRSAETWGNAFRRPELYGPLSDTTVHPPFERRQARR